MKLLDLLSTELWFSDLRQLSSSEVAEASREARLLGTIKGYERSMSKISEMLARVRLLKTLEGARIPQDTVDSAALIALQRLINALASAYMGTTPVDNEGRVLVRVLRGFSYEGMRLEEGDYTYLRLGDAAFLYASGFVDLPHISR